MVENAVAEESPSCVTYLGGPLPHYPPAGGGRTEYQVLWLAGPHHKAHPNPNPNPNPNAKQLVLESLNDLPVVSGASYAFDEDDYYPGGLGLGLGIGLGLGLGIGLGLG